MLAPIASSVTGWHGKLDLPSKSAKASAQEGLLPSGNRGSVPLTRVWEEAMNTDYNQGLNDVI